MTLRARHKWQSNRIHKFLVDGIFLILTDRDNICNFLRIIKCINERSSFGFLCF